MFYRRKVILALLQLFDDQLEKIRLQKLLFLFCQEKQKPEYDFIPYKYGCYSFSANADMATMVKKGILNEGQNYFEKNGKADYLAQLNPLDRELLLEVKTKFGNMSSTGVIKYTYSNYPFYAINSEVAESILNQEELENIIKAKPNENRMVLFTIGYEGISLEKYLVSLLKNNIKVLVDVRNNPLSMKYGFSKSQLKKFCESIGVQYLHFPKVGIQSEQRQELHSQVDYDRLFATYRKKNLGETTETQKEILNVLIQHKRIALTCFEANICQCHRKHLSEAIAKLPGFAFEVKHI